MLYIVAGTRKQAASHVEDTGYDGQWQYVFSAASAAWIPTKAQVIKVGAWQSLPELGRINAILALRECEVSTP